MMGSSRIQAILSVVMLALAPLSKPGRGGRTMVNPMQITYHPIGIIHSPFEDLVSMPIQPKNDASAPGRVEIYAPYVEGLKDLEAFSHLILIYHLHKVRGAALTVTPFLDSAAHGIFATRAPTRPNPIGLSVVRLKRIEGAVLHVADLDVLNGTPLLDLKPYVPDFDHRETVRTGWLEGVEGNKKGMVADDRFS